jgi:hypothetical protein
VRVLSLARVLFALLAFQLAVGLQIGVAHAAPPAALPMTTLAVKPSTNAASILARASSATATTDDACPMHSSSLQGSPHAKVPPNTSSFDKHDCCKSSGCQCQCGNVPLAFNVSLNRNSLASALVRPVRAVRAVVAPADTHFRPPIVS